MFAGRIEAHRWITACILCESGILAVLPYITGLDLNTWRQAWEPLCSELGAGKGSWRGGGPTDGPAPQRVAMVTDERGGGNTTSKVQSVRVIPHLWCYLVIQFQDEENKNNTTDAPLFQPLRWHVQESSWGGNILSGFHPLSKGQGTHCQLYQLHDKWKPQDDTLSQPFLPFYKAWLYSD